MADKGDGPTIGIDLGTTYSCVGVWQHDRVEIIANDQGNRTTPSYVAFTDSERLIEDAAKNQVTMNPINTVFGEHALVLGSLLTPAALAEIRFVHCEEKPKEPKEVSYLYLPIIIQVPCGGDPRRLLPPWSATGRHALVSVPGDGDAQDPTALRLHRSYLEEYGLYSWTRLVLHPMQLKTQDLNDAIVTPKVCSMKCLQNPEVSICESLQAKECSYFLLYTQFIPAFFGVINSFFKERG
ncbi:hypothetical protein ACJX0J_028575, partial [Zea mays]